MKHRYIISICVVLLCFSISSCSDFLEPEAKGLLTPENYFQNDAEAELALNGLQVAAPGAGILGDLLGTDMGVCGRFAIAGGWLSAVYEYDASTAAVRNGWSGAYSQVKNCNFVLEGIEASALSDETKGSTIAQTLFFRAAAYFELTYQYGDVPYWRNAVNIEEISTLGTTDALVIREGMIQDLEDAISSGYLSKSKWSDNNNRPTEWSVRMLKAYYHIWLEQWAEAREELIQITANSPHTLSPDYADMYRQGNEMHQEIIFGRQNLIGVVNNRGFETFHFNSNAENSETIQAMKETDVFARSSAQTLRKSFADTFDDNDARKVYNVWESHTLEDGTEANFNWIYVPRKMRAALPLSDPLCPDTEPIGQSSEPTRSYILADAYLLLAEAEFMLNGSSSEAVAALNNIRERTSLPLYTDITMEDIRNERAWELCGEGYMGRKKDLRRWGILESTVLGVPAAETAAGAYQLAIDRAQDEADIIAGAPIGKYQIYPVPLGEILISQDIGGALTQNPLWD